MFKLLNCYKYDSGWNGEVAWLKRNENPIWDGWNLTEIGISTGHLSKVLRLASISQIGTKWDKVFPPFLPTGNLIQLGDFTISYSDEFYFNSTWLTDCSNPSKLHQGNIKWNDLNIKRFLAAKCLRVPYIFSYTATLYFTLFSFFLFFLSCLWKSDMNLPKEDRPNQTLPNQTNLTKLTKF